MRPCTSVLAALLLVAAAPVRAEAPAAPAPEPAPAATPEAAPPAETTPTAPAVPAAPAAPAVDRESAAWGTYADAAELVVQKRDASAMSALDRLRTEFAGTAAAARGEALRTLLVPTLTPPAPGRKIDPANPATWLRPESVDPLARAELVVFQTMHGIALGAETCFLFGNACTIEFGALSVLAGGGAGLGLSLLLSSNGLTPGHTAAMNAGTLWGAWHGLAINLVLQSGSSTQTSGLLIGGQLLGLGAGHLIHEMLQPAVGDVSLANSGGLWSGVLAALLLNAAQVSNAQALFGILLASTDVGLIAGALASRYFPMSRGRTLVIDAGCVLGLFVGWALGTLTGIGSASSQSLFGIMAVGLVAGGAGGFWFSRGWDKPPLPAPMVGFLPTPGGGTATLAWNF